MELKGKLGQSSVNGLLNNSSSVNPLPIGGSGRPPPPIIFEP